MKNRLTILLALFLISNLTAQIVFEDFEDEQISPNIVLVPNIEGTDGIVTMVDGYGFNSNRGLLMGKSSDGDLTRNAVEIRLSDNDIEPHMYLSFNIRDNNDENHPEDGLFISIDGQPFEQVYTFKPQQWCDNWGAFPPFSVDRLAQSVGLELTNEFIIRFQQLDDADFGFGNTDGDGLSIDNIRVYSAPPVYATLPFEDDFDSTVNPELNPSWKWSHANDTAFIEGTTKPTGFVGITNTSGTSGSKGVLLGKIENCDDGLTANALDLYMDLSNCSDILLSFDYRDFFNEFSEQDGLYFSNDGGVNFTSIFPIDFSMIQDNTWQTFSVFLDNLVEEVDLTYSDQCVLRFQQYDDADFLLGNTDADGFIIDNVLVQCGAVNTINHLNTSEGMQVYPNPVTNDIILDLNGNFDEGNYQIFDLQGQLLLEGVVSGNKTSIDMSALSAGIYVISFISENGFAGKRKIVKQ